MEEVGRGVSDADEVAHARAAHLERGRVAMVENLVDLERAPIFPCDRQGRDRTVLVEACNDFDVAFPSALDALYHSYVPFTLW